MVEGGAISDFSYESGDSTHSGTPLLLVGCEEDRDTGKSQFVRAGIDSVNL